MEYWGLLNYDFGFGMNNWFMPSYSFNINPFMSFDNSAFLNTYQFPSYNFTQSFLNYTPSYTYTPMFTTYNPVSTTQKTDTGSYVVASKPAQQELKVPKPGLNVPKVNIGISLDGYNASAGKRLADIALKNSVGWSGYCARSVKKAISQANLGSYQYGHAYQMPSILRNNRNFKEIPVDAVDVKDLPAGCILVYDKGKEGYSREYGHTEITTGDGRAVSDGITRNLHKKPSAIFMPVEHDYLA